MLGVDHGGIRKVLMDYIQGNEINGPLNKFLHVYLDSRQIKTIGIGFNLERSGARRVITRLGRDYDKILSGQEDLTEDEARALFAPDVDDAIDGARRLVSNFSQLDAARQIVIVDMVFNMGAGGFAQFRQLIAALEKSDFATAADEMQFSGPPGQRRSSAWFSQVKSRGVRDVEAMRTGALPAQFQRNRSGGELRFGVPHAKRSA